MTEEDLLSSDHAAVVRRYDEIWAEAEGASRLAALAEIWADDGVYVDPDMPDGVPGREALSELIAASQTQ